MGKSFWISSESETKHAGIESDFRMAFWYDELKVLGKLGCAPLTWFSEHLKYDQDGFGELLLKPRDLKEWLNRCQDKMMNNRDTLPVMYFIWFRENHNSKRSGSPLFAHEDVYYQVYANWIKLVATKVHNVDQMIHSTSLLNGEYEIPETSQKQIVWKPVSYEGWGRLSGMNEYQFNIVTFQTLFKKTPFELEYGDFLDYFSNEFKLIKEIIDFCDEHNEKIFLSF